VGLFFDGDHIAGALVLAQAKAEARGSQELGDGRWAEHRGHRTGKFGIKNGADGISDIEGKAATGSGEQAEKRASFNGADGFISR